MNQAFVEWVDDGAGRVPVFFNQQRCLVDVMHDYVDHIAESKCRTESPRGYASMVDAATYALLCWLRYLDAEKLSWLQADDKLLEEFRDTELKEVMRSPQGKRDQRTAKRTVNVKLQWIYRFYSWAESTHWCMGVIGPRRRITSMLTRKTLKKGRRKRRGDADLYPLCFHGVGGGSGPQYFATKDDKRRMLQFFAKATDPFLAERNRLIVELSDRVGWRAGTVTGLSIDDFLQESQRLEDDDGVTVTPKVQKFGYRNSFQVPHSLFARVVRFTEMRSRWLANRGWSESRAEHFLFVSSRTGRPLGMV